MHDIDGMDPRHAPLEKNLRETTGRGTDVEAEEYITHDLSGESSEFVSGESAQISPEEVEAILRQLSSGSGGMGDLDSSWE
jgi:hypothetical protein